MKSIFDFLSYWGGVLIGISGILAIVVFVLGIIQSVTDYNKTEPKDWNYEWDEME